MKAELFEKLRLKNLPKYPWEMNSRIAFDFDDVLFPYVYRFWKLCREHYSVGVANPATIQEPYFDQILDCDYQKAQEIYESLLKNKDLWTEFHNIEPDPEATMSLKKLKQAGKSLEIVTARSPNIQKITEECIDRMFPGIFDQIHFCNTYGQEGIKRTKAEVCLENNLTVLVDDSLSNISNVEAQGILGIPFGKYPWSQRADTLTEWPKLVEKLLNL